MRVQSCQMSNNIVPNLTTDLKFSNIELSKVRNDPQLIPTRKFSLSSVIVRVGVVLKRAAVVNNLLTPGVVLFFIDFALSFWTTFNTVSAKS